MNALDELPLLEIFFATERLLIGGERRPCAGGETLALEAPPGGTELVRIARSNAADADAAVSG